jgi:hypothetical protein
MIEDEFIVHTSQAHERVVSGGTGESLTRQPGEQPF